MIEFRFVRSDSRSQRGHGVGKGISDVVTFAIGVAISPVPIIAVILMLFSRRARINGLSFLCGWVLALGVVSTITYLIANQSSPTTSSTASDSISWGKIVLGVLFLLLALRNWRNRVTPGTEHEMPKWMAGVDAFTPAKSFGLGLLLAGVNPKNLILTVGAAAGLAQLKLSTTDVVVSLVVFVMVASSTIGGPVACYLIGGEQAKGVLDEMKDWLRVHNDAVMAVLFLVFGVDLIAKGLPPLT
jgi:threonine/homoserine/homoserine lactone efflux protein